MQPGTQLAVVARRTTRVTLVLALLFYAAFIARSAFRVGETLYFSLFDDAMISMTYARNLAAGAGLVWDPVGEPVQGYTNLLWTLWMSVLHLTGLHESKVALAVMVSGAVILLLTAFAARAVARALCDDAPGAGLVAFGLTALYYPLAFWTLRGMEVGALALLVALAILQAVRLSREFSWTRVAGALAALCGAVLLRPDGLIPFVVVWFFVIRLSPTELRVRVALLGASAALVVVAAVGAFGLLYYGDPLPNTFYLKLGGVPLASRLARGATTFAGVFVYHLFAPVALGVFVLARRREWAVWLPGVLVGALFSYSIYVGGDAWEWMHYSNRYVSVAMPMLFVLCGVAVHEIGRMDGAGAARVAAVAAWALGGMLALGGAVVLAGESHNTVWLGRYNHFRFFGGGGALLLGAGLLLALLLTRSVGRLSSSVAARDGETRELVVAGVVLIVGLVLVNSYGSARWLVYNAEHLGVDTDMARLGLHLRSSTPASASIAVLRAGAVPYFSHRHSFDLLGKNDAVVARAPARRNARGEYMPGHTSWDLGFSIGELDPDIVTPLGVTLGREHAEVLEMGYEELDNGIFVRADWGAETKARLGQAWDTPGMER